MRLGTISNYINRKTFLIFILQLFFVVLILGYRAWKDSSIECIGCHSNKKKMEELGYPELYVTQEMVEKESRHPYVHCIQCHLGNGRAKDAEKAHKGMLSVIFVGHDGNIVRRKDIYRGALLPTGEDKIRRMLPHVEINGELWPHWMVRNVLWHDRSRETFGYDPGIAKKTCGRPDCHPSEFKQFNTTHMGTNFRQRTMKTWLEPYGPHNCGPSFADIARSEKLSKIGFSFKNTEKIAEEMNVPLSRYQAMDKQKFCNICHTGCLDCHYAPDRLKGVHNFNKVPRSESCAGYGRGTSICHPGAMQSRRGETYIGGDFSIPVGMEPDVHYKKDIHCVDCHTTGEKGMGDMQRKAICQDCHIEIEDAHSKGIHKNMDCASCHINELRGYQITVWGPGNIAGRMNPFKKYLYYGIQKPPILIKDQKGIWMPVKIWPHMVGNIKPDVRRSSSIQFRWPDGQTRDAYFVLGTFDSRANNKHLLWFELQQASHPFGKARDCDSCHKESQVAVSEWEFMDNQGARNNFKGGYKIVANKDGLRINDMRIRDQIEIAEGYKIEDFASWVDFRDKWYISGDFSIKADARKYNKYLWRSKKTERLLNDIDKKINKEDRKLINKYKELRGIVFHNLDNAEDLIAEFKKKFM